MRHGQRTVQRGCGVQEYRRDGVVHSHRSPSRIVRTITRCVAGSTVTDRPTCPPTSSMRSGTPAAASAERAARTLLPAMSLTNALDTPGNIDAPARALRLKKRHECGDRRIRELRDRVVIILSRWQHAVRKRCETLARREQHDGNARAESDGGEQLVLARHAHATHGDGARRSGGRAVRRGTGCNKRRHDARRIASRLTCA